MLSELDDDNQEKARQNACTREIWNADFTQMAKEDGICCLTPHLPPLQHLKALYHKDSDQRKQRGGKRINTGKSISHDIWRDKKLIKEIPRMCAQVCTVSLSTMMTKSAQKTMKKKLAKPEKLQLAQQGDMHSSFQRVCDLPWQSCRSRRDVWLPVALPNWWQPHMHDNQCHCGLSLEFCSYLGGGCPVDPKDNVGSPRSWPEEVRQTKKRGSLWTGKYTPYMICPFLRYTRHWNMD